MQSRGTVDKRRGSRLQVVSTKYPMDRIRLLEAVQQRRGDDFISRTVAHALDSLINAHFPGAIEEAA